MYPNITFFDQFICLSTLHDKYVIVPADKASNTIVFVCKEYYFKCFVNVLDFNSTQGSETYVASTLSKEEILHNHRSVLSSFGIQTKEEDLDLPSLYWIPKLHKNPYKQWHIAGSAKCSTKTLSQILTSLLSAVRGSSEIL